MNNKNNFNSTISYRGRTKFCTRVSGVCEKTTHKMFVVSIQYSMINNNKVEK